jgi:hypothetical protein
MKTYTAFILLVICTWCRAGGFPFKDEYPLDLGSSWVGGKAVLTLSKNTCRIDSTFEVDVRFINTAGRWGYVYNPFFVPVCDAPAALALYDKDKHFLGEYLYHEGSNAGTPVGSFVAIPASGYAGATIKIFANKMASSGVKISPGTYYLQVIYFNAFLGIDSVGHSAYGPNGPGDPKELFNHFDYTELFRSNVVEIEFKN